jgi:peptidoglycan/LPS O-acetylase OafA/YrhL
MEFLGWLHVPDLGAIPNWTLTMFCSLGFAYAFYLAVEKPSHALARRINVMGRPRAVVQEPLQGIAQ